MSASRPFRTAAAGAVVAALLGCAAGNVMRPELGEADTGRTLVVSRTPDLTNVVSYEDSWWSTHVEDGGY